MAISVLFDRRRSFWKWFSRHEDRLAGAAASDPIRFLGNVVRRLRRVHRSLVCELGPEADGKRQFVISADGNKTAFPVVVELASMAPPLRRWTIVKFRQRNQDLDEFTLRFGEIEIKPSDVEVHAEPVGEVIGLMLFIRGCTGSDDRYARAAFILLDQTLGEFDMETKVGPVEVLPFESHRDLRRLPLVKLPATFDTLAAGLRARADQA
jgi:hypothetical protein